MTDHIRLDELMEIGADLVLQTVEALIQHTVELRVQRSFSQGSEELRPAPKLTKELCRIDWRRSTDEIYNLVRGLSPSAGSCGTISRSRCCRC